MKKLLPILVIVLAAGYLVFHNTIKPTPAINTESFVQPISRAHERITRKPFGLYVSPAHSPVSPEKFTGYHTGVDFETFADEADVAVPVYAICDGPLVMKKWATGYGGVAVQNCQLNGQSVSVIYGHLKLSSITSAQGSQLSKGEQLAILGQGYSTDTDGERKHLHLGIHLGSVINIAGYVQRKNDLKNWLDFAKLNSQ